MSNKGFDCDNTGKKITWKKFYANFRNTNSFAYLPAITVCTQDLYSPSDVLVLDPPAEFTAVLNGFNSIDLTWISDNFEYLIIYDNTVNLLEINTDNYNASDLDRDTLHTFSIRAKKDKVLSRIISVDIYTSPNDPTDLAISDQTSDSVTITWTDNSSIEEGYSIERGENSEVPNWEIVGTTAADITEFLDSGLSLGSYQYRVRAFIGEIYSDYGMIEVDIDGDGPSRTASGGVIVNGTANVAANTSRLGSGGVVVSGGDAAISTLWIASNDASVSGNIDINAGASPIGSSGYIAINKNSTTADQTDMLTEAVGLFSDYFVRITLMNITQDVSTTIILISAVDAGVFCQFEFVELPNSPDNPSFTQTNGDLIDVSFGTTISALSVAAPVINSVIAQSAGILRLTIQSNSDSEEGYSLERSLDGGVLDAWVEIHEFTPGLDGMIGGVGQSADYDDEGLDATTEYFYRIRAFNTELGNGDWSAGLISGTTADQLEITSNGGDATATVYINTGVDAVVATVEATGGSGDIIYSLGVDLDEADFTIDPDTGETITSLASGTKSIRVIATDAIDSTEDSQTITVHITNGDGEDVLYDALETGVEFEYAGNTAPGTGEFQNDGSSPQNFIFDLTPSGASALLLSFVGNSSADEDNDRIVFTALGVSVWSGVHSVVDDETTITVNGWNYGTIFPFPSGTTVLVQRRPLTV